MRKIGIILIFSLLLAGCGDSKVNTHKISSADFFIIAHRGASAYAPEHTIFAYELAQRMEATYIEIDLQMTEDGILVAMHDQQVDRTTNGVGFVKEYTLEELKQLNAGKWFNDAYPDLAVKSFENLDVPTLEEIFSRFGDEVNYYIEIKSPKIYEGMEEELISLLHQYNLIRTDEGLPKVIIQSFNEDSLRKVHELEPGLPLIQLYRFNDEAALSEQDFTRLSTYASGIGVNISSVQTSFIQEVQLNGFKVHLYTSKSEPEIEMRKILQLKANGVFTDTPNLGVLLLKQNNER